MKCVYLLLNFRNLLFAFLLERFDLVFVHAHTLLRRPQNFLLRSKIVFHAHEFLAQATALFLNGC